MKRCNIYNRTGNMVNELKLFETYIKIINQKKKQNENCK